MAAPRQRLHPKTSSSIWYPRTIAKLARHHYTFTCDVGVVSVHPVWAWLCDRRTAKIFPRNLCQRPIRENFVPRKFLAIRVFAFKEEATLVSAASALCS